MDINAHNSVAFDVMPNIAWSLWKKNSRKNTEASLITSKSYTLVFEWNWKFHEHKRVLFPLQQELFYVIKSFLDNSRHK